MGKIHLIPCDGACIPGAHLVDQVCQVFQLETGFKAALRIIPCCDLMGEIEGFEHSFSEAI